MSRLEEINDCWNQIGVEGDLTCEQLTQVAHCRNCSVYRQSGRLLLERELPVDYIQEWTDPVAEHGSALSPRSSEEMLSVIWFSLGHEQFAFSIRSLQEVIHPTRIYPLPRRSDRIFLGLTPVRGEILLCASLHEFLDLESLPTPDARMLIVGTQHQKWVLPVDQVHGIHRYPMQQIQDPPVVVTKTSTAYTQGILTWDDQKVSYLNADQLIDTLDRGIL